MAALMVRNEPVLAATTALVTAGIGLLVAFGVEFTAEQTTAVVSFVAAVYAVAVLVRARVSPVRRSP